MEPAGLSRRLGKRSNRRCGRRNRPAETAEAEANKGAAVSRDIEAASRSDSAHAGSAKVANVATRLAKISRNPLKEDD
jgi:hypothetical protein